MLKTTLSKVFHPLLAIMLLVGCSENFSDNPNANQSPKTFLSFFTTNDLNPSISRQTLNWWGDDPDGIVVGFIYTFDNNAPNVDSWNNDAPAPNWTFTTETRETFSLTLSGADTVYTFRVKAVDDAGAADPEGAIQQFPIINTRPTVDFPSATDVPETTFTVATFIWSSFDLDGSDTIARFEYLLDDTTDDSAWKAVEPTLNAVTLSANEGLTEGEHVFYLRAVDLASAQSDIIRMPRSEDDIWFVREPRSSFLVIDDYNIADGSADLYHSTLQALVGTVDVWDIKSNGKALEPPSSAFIGTLLLFERIFWYADGDPNLEKAQVSIPTFLDNGGKILMSTSFAQFATNQGDPLDFSPVDSLDSRIARITRNQLVKPAAAFAAMGFPDLQVNTAIIPFVFPLVPKISSEVFYVLPERPGSWPGTPVMGAINANSTFVFIGLPLAKLDGQATVNQLFDKVLNEIF